AIRIASLFHSLGRHANCVNVADGFEGPLDPARHRGTVAGWKKIGLPWVQG
ncbi:MAG: rhodanese-like domain-containing protein, partial [Pseudomonadota bacterium]